MKEYSVDYLNKLAMEIILYASECRDFISEAFTCAIQENGDFDKIRTLLVQAREKITQAHKLQTDVIQSTVYNDHQQITMLFIHGQDTLMTVSSELFVCENILQLYYQKMIK